jgi:aminopeptidase N
VLRENEQKAKIHFEEVKPMMDCFQSKFGQYPFADDGYKLIETPYLGMEHQSAVAYGNMYKKGYLGSDLSGTGYGLLFDFIIIHESGHEWFGNSITSSDIADMWIHESFTTYSEAVYVECLYGYEKALKYINGIKNNIHNDKPIIGPIGVNKKGSGDMYPKGAVFLNTLRHIINNDDKWWQILYKFSETFRHKIIDTETVINFFKNETQLNLTPIFNQYLRYKKIPVLELKENHKFIEYRWNTNESDFEMPFEYTFDNKQYRVIATNKWQKLPKNHLKNAIKFDTDKMYFQISK